MSASVSHSHPIPASGFDRFPLAPALRRGVAAAGFLEPRPIQAEALGPALAGRDVLGIAQTGTGKTAAFGLAILERLLATSRPGPRALVVAPTRELVTQIDAELRLLARFTRLRSLTLYGGVSIGAQISALRNRPDLLVVCPGRLLDLLERRALRLDAVEVLVLDEADHLFDMGFLPDVRRIVAALPRKRQNLLFSASMPAAVRHLADGLLSQPHVVELGGSATPAETIEHALYPVAEARKRELLEKLLSAPECESAIVFTRTKHRAKRLADQLDRAQHRAVALQGNMSQGQRDRAMRGFRGGRFDVLVATDIAARGIDVSQVSHVINFDVPDVPEHYTHRIGRTGRAERKGTACTFVTRDDRGKVRAIETMLGTPIARRELDGFTDAAEAASGAGPRSHAPGPRRNVRGGGGGYRSHRRPGARRWSR
jgi:ATP-dependent RNA helicase RhlE